MTAFKIHQRTFPSTNKIPIFLPHCPILSDPHSKFKNTKNLIAKISATSTQNRQIEVVTPYDIRGN